MDPRGPFLWFKEPAAHSMVVSVRWLTLLGASSWGQFYVLWVTTYVG